MPKNLFGSGIPGQSQRQIIIYRDIRAYPNTGEELFSGEIVYIYENGQEIPTGSHATLVYDDEVGFRPPTEEELNAISERYKRKKEAKERLKKSGKKSGRGTGEIKNRKILLVCVNSGVYLWGGF